METWQLEVVELHAFFEAYFRGELPAGDVERFERVLAPGFTIVAPGGRVSSRGETLTAVRSNHGGAPDLRIRVEAAELLVAGDRSSTGAGLLVGRYVEVHDSPAGTTRRLSTVVMSPAPEGPNGLVWRTVHETWLA